MSKTITSPTRNSLQEVADYLVANGFMQATAQDLQTYRFTKYPFQIYIRHDNVDIMKADEMDAGLTGLHYEWYESHSGVARFGLMDWILLFHITKVLPLKEFLQAAKMRNINARQDILQALGISFLPSIS